MWQHRVTGECKYKEEFSNTDSAVTVNEYADLVGLPTVDEDVTAILQQSLASKIKQELLD